MERHVCWQTKQTLQMKYICPMWKVNRSVRLIALGVVTNSIITALPKDFKTRFTLSSSVFLAQESTYLSCFPICICILVESNSYRNIFKTYFCSSKDRLAQAEYQSGAWCILWTQKAVLLWSHYFRYLMPSLH